MALQSSSKITNDDEARRQKQEQERAARTERFVPFWNSKENQGMAFQLVAPITDDNPTTHVLYTCRGVNFYGVQNKPKRSNGSDIYEIRFPEQEFNAKTPENYDPMVYLSNHPELAKPIANKPNDVVEIKKSEWVTVLIRCSEQFTIDSLGEQWDSDKYPIQDQIKAFTIEARHFRELMKKFENEAKKKGTEVATNTIYVLTRAKSGSGKGARWNYLFMPDYSSDSAKHIVDYKTIVPDIRAPDFVQYATFDSQKRLLEDLGVVLPYNDPDAPAESDEE